MLILTRRIGEKLCIYPNEETSKNDIFVELKIMEIQRGQVRIGINAPPNVIIHREEIYRKIMGEI